MEAQGGYNQDRFISTVPRRLVCGICHQVLREPRLCEDGEHCFCFSCISQYLKGCQICPECRNHLTPETLVHPQTYLRETLRELVIKCDYIERGCPDHIQLGNLQDHVSHCGFAPLTCEKCGMQINRRDKDNHENSVCQLGDMKANQNQMKQELCLLKSKLAQIDEMKARLDVIEVNHNVVPAQLDEIMNDQEEYLKSITENQHELKRRYDQMDKKLKSINRSLKESKRKRNQVEVVSMGAAQRSVQESYDVSRFVGEVNQDLLCSICNEVPKDPRLCKDKDHIFCKADISRHLENYQTCPVCRDPLTQETLRRPTGFLKNCLDDLKMKCDNHDRGCPNVFGLESLTKHVKQCKFAPVMCGIGCGMVVNKNEKENHEKNLCQSRNVKYHDYTQIKSSQDEMKASLDELKGSQDEWKESLNSMNESLNESERKRNQLEENLNSMNESLNESEMKRNQLENDVREMKKQFELFAEKFNQVADQPLSNFASSKESKEIIIMGGSDGKQVKKSVSIFNPANGTYAELPPMNCPRMGASSCVYNNDVIVTGGSDGKHCLDSIEILRINQDLSRWTILNSRLPAKLRDHVLKVYQEKFLVIGGWDGDRQTPLNEIHELALENPYTPTLLATVPEPRIAHAAEIVDDKLFILGGKTSFYADDKVVHDSVVVYDFITKEFQTFPSLPKPVCHMSTVTWGKKIIVVGGEDKAQGVLNDVNMYDIESERWEPLPPLRCRRYGHSTVMINDVIFVFGGWNREWGVLKSVESFKMGSDGWKVLPGMKENRNFPTAIVKP